MIKGRLVVFIYGAKLSADETVTSWISTFTRISSFIQGIVQASQCSEVPSEKAFVQPVHRQLQIWGAVKSPLTLRRTLRGGMTGPVEV